MKLTSSASVINTDFAHSASFTANKLPAAAPSRYSFFFFFNTVINMYCSGQARLQTFAQYEQNNAEVSLIQFALYPGNVISQFSTGQKENSACTLSSVRLIFLKSVIQNIQHLGIKRVRLI